MFELPEPNHSLEDIITTNSVSLHPAREILFNHLLTYTAILPWIHRGAMLGTEMNPSMNPS